MVKTTNHVCGLALRGLPMTFTHFVILISLLESISESSTQKKVFFLLFLLFNGSHHMLLPLFGVPLYHIGFRTSQKELTLSLKAEKQMQCIIIIITS